MSTLAAAVGAVDPGNCCPPLELRSRGDDQGLTDAEQSIHVDAIVDLGLHCGHEFLHSLVIGSVWNRSGFPLRTNRIHLRPVLHRMVFGRIVLEGRVRECEQPALGKPEVAEA